MYRKFWNHGYIMLAIVYVEDKKKKFKIKQSVINISIIYNNSFFL